jgi:hypothetical protein
MYKLMKNVAIPFLFLAVIVWGCSNNDEPETFNCNTVVTYTDDVLPIFEAKCQDAGCHPTNGNWFDYTIAKNMASEIKRRITLSDSDPAKMPKVGSLTKAQIETIVCWVNNGTPE